MAPDFLTLSPLFISVSPAVLWAHGIVGALYRTVGGYLLGRLGVATPLQGAGIGAAVAVDAKDERLVA